ncbi:SAM-dependent methyltransferase [Gilvimarinus agarilyticus]|uniref:SAM-dependent methyltransferase n=1 Tax=Gilvimarinus agarilyticus TaxID=679259 RepID=UPI00059F1E8F|nr:cyclopropane-fatty-acyl-phospholipid synthase family protein [Gilvimarinus agarilyticus]
MTMETLNRSRIERHVKPSMLDRVAKQQVVRQLKKIRVGRLIIEDQDEILYLGEPATSEGPHAHIVVNQPSAYRGFMLGGSIGGAEGYMAGAWSSPNLTALTKLMCANIDLLNSVDGSRVGISKLLEKFYHWSRRNTEEKARANIAAHYDLSNQFFSLFLDKSMMYSAARFSSPTTTLEQASEDKIDNICQKLHLTSADHLLEIGTGWGAMAIHAARHYGCQVTTTTISQEQYRHACQAVEQAGLSQQVTVLCQDYRKLTGQYDKLVSIEMIEAVGHEYYREYFSTCSARLKSDGLMLLQAITIPDQRFEYAKGSVDFIQKYIFPGGCLPSDREITHQLSRHTDMQMIGMEDIGEDYALTLAHWRQRFHGNIDQVKALGFNDTFIRMWEYYLSYCEGGFSERVIGTGQFLLAKPQWRQPAH